MRDLPSGKEEKYRRMQGTWPVIALSFAKVKETTYIGAKERICQIITDIYNKCDFLVDSGKLNEKEKDFYRSGYGSMDLRFAGRGC